MNDMGVSAHTWIVVGLFMTGCTTLLGIDGDYVQSDLESGSGGVGSVPSASGGGLATGAAPGAGGVPIAAGGTGGLLGSGGDPSSGGDVASGGEPGAGGALPGCGFDAAVCEDGQKCCGGICVAPQPIIGCSFETCEPCPQPPAQGISVCRDGECAVECNPGYVEMDGDCVPDGIEPPDSGSGGDPNLPTCEPEECTGCSVIGPFGCCRNNGTCGCTWAPIGYCL